MLNSPTTPGFKKFFSTPERMLKRSKIPPPLNLSPSSPPQSVKKARYNEEDDISFFDKSSPLYSKQNFIMNEKCAICSELVSIKLKNEEIIKLKCNHICHFDCFSIYKLDKELFECSQCGEKNLKPIDSNLNSAVTLTPDDDVAPETQISAFNPNFNDIPTTPVDQLIRNTNPSGFRSPASSINSNKTNSSPKLIDLIKPNINLISYRTGEEISNVLNIFINELEDNDIDVSEEIEIKLKIEKILITFLIQSIKDTKGINFPNLTNLKLFDSFEISIDNKNYEEINCFIFESNLILFDLEFSNIIGTILLRDISSIKKINEFKLNLNLKTALLPELTIRSNNNILISKYENFFENIEVELPLIQMSTNLWSLVEDSNIEIPDEIRKFNELTSIGLDLPINLLKSIIPKPTPKSVNLILVIQLFNFTDKSNEEYLKMIQNIVNTTLLNLGNNDKLGIIIQGWDGERNFDVYKSSYLGMTPSNWEGWEELINEFDVFKPKQEINGNLILKSLYQSLKKLNLMIVGEVKEIVLINGIRSEVSYEADDIEIMKEFKVNHFELEMNSFSEDMINSFIDYEEKEGQKIRFYKNYMFKIYSEEEFKKLFINLKRIVISNFEINVKIPNDYKLKSIEGKECECNEIVININNLHDGYYKNVQFELELIDKPIDIPIKYKYNKNEINYKQKMNLPFNKDSILVKREIELMIIEKIKTTEKEEIVELINLKIQGCSTKYLNFFKLSEFNKKYKNFVNFIDELQKIINSNSNLLIIKLKLEDINN